ncbi:MAG: hypothetical protein EAZ85_09055 [Bacteroidetes bacterium]|nr:MAG: hypothetical protein EAZ85_09055 [Bacteroidota bacterium]TAG88064.1 MAG: hypothetical protein EAZ20_09390 [Bacteroidota bacterium]
MKILAQEKTFAGKILDEIWLEIENERTTVANIIEQKVAQETTCFNKNLVQKQNQFKDKKQNALNGYQMADKLALADAEKETYKAYQAFESNQLILLVDEVQMKELSTEVLVNPDTNIQFIKLMPLVGG